VHTIVACQAFFLNNVDNFLSRLFGHTKIHKWVSGNVHATLTTEQALLRESAGGINGQVAAKAGRAADDSAVPGTDSTGLDKRSGGACDRVAAPHTSL